MKGRLVVNEPARNGRAHVVSAFKRASARFQSPPEGRRYSLQKPESSYLLRNSIRLDNPATMAHVYECRRTCFRVRMRCSQYPKENVE